MSHKTVHRIGTIRDAVLAGSFSSTLLLIVEVSRAFMYISHTNVLTFPLGPTHYGPIL